MSSDSFVIIDAAYVVPADTKPCDSASAPPMQSVNPDYVPENITTPDPRIIENVFKYAKMRIEDSTTLQAKLDDANKTIDIMRERNDILAAENGQALKVNAMLRGELNTSLRELQASKQCYIDTCREYDDILGKLRIEYNTLSETHQAMVYVINTMRKMTAEDRTAWMNPVVKPVEPAIEPVVTVKPTTGVEITTVEEPVSTLNTGQGFTIGVKKPDGTLKWVDYNKYYAVDKKTRLNRFGILHTYADEKLTKWYDGGKLVDIDDPSYAGCVKAKNILAGDMVTTVMDGNGNIVPKDTIDTELSSCGEKGCQIRK